MPTDEDRIRILKERIATRNKKVEALVAYQKAKSKNEADEAAIATLAAELAKKVANQQRIDDNHAKIVIGVAMLQLPFPVMVRALSVLRTFLTGRHREFLEKWSAKREMDITVATRQVLLTAQPYSAVIEASPQTSSFPVSHIGTILAKIISEMNEGTFNLIGPELLSVADGEERTALEEWYTKLDHDRQASKNDVVIGQERQSSQEEMAGDGATSQ